MNTERPIILSTIINSYNRIDLLRLALPSIVSALEQCPFAASIVIYDARSADGSAEWAEQFAREHRNIRIEVISPSEDEDGSFSTGINSACHYAAKTFPGIKWYLLFETDNWVKSGEPLEQALTLLENHSDLAAAGFTVRKHSGAPAGYGCSFPTAIQFVLGQQLTHWLRLDAPRPSIWRKYGNICWSTCDVVFTSPLLIRRTVWEETGGLDAKHFPYSETDLDWARRVYKLKWKMAVIETAQVVHDNNQTLSHWSTSRVLHFHRARMRLLQRELGPWVYFLIPALICRHCLEFIALSCLRIGRKNWIASLRQRLWLIRGAFTGYESL